MRQQTEVILLIFNDVRTHSTSHRFSNRGSQIEVGLKLETFYS